MRVSPAGARVFLDDALLSAGSFEGKVVKSDKTRQIRVEAEHHVSKEESVALTSDVILSFSLEKEGSGAGARRPFSQGAYRGRPAAAAAAPEPQAAQAPPAAAPAQQPAPTPAPAARPGADRQNEARHRLGQPLRPMKRPLALAALLSSLFTAPALAQGPTPPPPAPPPPAAAPPAGAPARAPGEADAHFRRGIELYKEADYPAALIEFRRAYEIDPRYQALYNIGEDYFQLQDYANALKTLEKYLKDGGAQISAARREEVQKEVDKLRTRVATLDVTTSVPDVEIAVDDVSMGKTPLAAPLVVSAGRRRLTATRPGKPPVTQIVELAGGDAKKLVINLPDDGGGPEVAPPAKVPAAPWVITGVLTAGAVVTGALALGASGTLKTDLTTGGIDQGTLNSDHSKTFALALTTDILIGAAIVAGGISIYFTATAGSKPDKASPLPAGRPRRGAARGAHLALLQATRRLLPLPPDRGRPRERPALRRLLINDGGRPPYPRSRLTPRTPCETQALLLASSPAPASSSPSSSASGSSTPARSSSRAARINARATLTARASPAASPGATR